MADLEITRNRRFWSSQSTSGSLFNTQSLQNYLFEDFLKTVSDSLKDLIKMLNVLATPKDKTQRQIISFINSLFISLFELQGRVAQRPINSLLFKTP